MDSIKDFFASIPKFWWGPLIIIGGILFFTLSDPPKTICDTQNEIFFKENEKYIYGTKGKRSRLPPEIQLHVDMCMKGNTSGGCYDWMLGLRHMLNTLKNVPSQCTSLPTMSSPNGGGETLKKWLDQSAWLFSQISWNESMTVRSGLYNWLDTEDISIYCKLKREYVRLVGAPAWSQLEKNFLKQLVQEKKMEQAEAWQRTILSYKCPQ